VGDVGILLNYAKGEPIRALGAIFQHNPLVFISKESSGIMRPFEMKGKRVMQRSTATDDAPLRVMLNNTGITSEYYTRVKHSFSIEELVSGQVDVMSAYITDQPFALRQRGIKINVFKQHYKSPSSIENLRNEALEVSKLILADSVPIGGVKIERLRHVADVYNDLKLFEKLTESKLNQFIYPNVIKINLTEEEQTWLKLHPVIRLGIDNNFAPYEWIDYKGRYRGISADYIRLMEQHLGVKFEEANEFSSWDEVLNAAKQGKLDIMSCLVL
jgi:hypothetical protein